jgi:hypothetical protein
VGVSVGGANVLFESLKASVVKNPLALSVVKSECKLPLNEGDERVELAAELKYGLMRATLTTILRPLAKSNSTL